MSNQIKNGDIVVFTRQYPYGDPLASLYGLKGEVIELQGQYVVVDFDHALITVNLADVETGGQENEQSSSDIGTDTITLMEDHECSGMQRSQLVAHKLIAQENDEKLDYELEQLLNITE